MRRQLRAYACVACVKASALLRLRTGRAAACRPRSHGRRVANVRGLQQFPDQLLRDARKRFAAPAALAAYAAPHHLVALQVDDVQGYADRGLAVDADLVTPFVDG